MSAPASNPEPEPWLRLASLARRDAPEVDDFPVPYGFATRIVAAWQSERPENPWIIREAFAWRGALVAAAITLASVAINYDLLLGIWYGETALAGSLLQTFASP
jgi:hypothetical protein